MYDDDVRLRKVFFPANLTLRYGFLDHGSESMLLDFLGVSSPLDVVFRRDVGEQSEDFFADRCAGTLVPSLELKI